MTGGQMAPTTLDGQKSTTCIYGRNPEINGNPVKMCELLSTLTGPAYIARQSLCDVKHIVQAKKAIKKPLNIRLTATVLQWWNFCQVARPTGT